MRLLIISLLLFIQFIAQSQNMGIKLPIGSTPATTLDINGSLAYREGGVKNVTATPSHNFTIDSMSFYRVSTSLGTDFTITGITSGQNGRVLSLYNASNYLMTLVNQTGSIASNQIITGTGSNIVVGSGGIITLYYNATLSRWICMAITGQVSDWSLTGNSGTTAGTHFLGTTDAQSLVFKTNNSTSLTVPVEGRGGQLVFSNNRYGGSGYPSRIGYQDIWNTGAGDIDTSFSILGSIGYNDLFYIGGRVKSNTIATSGELHIASGDDGDEPIIFEQFNQATNTLNERLRINNVGHVGIGMSDPQFKLHLVDTSGPDSDIGIRLYNANNLSHLPSLQFQVSGGTRSAPSAVVSGTSLGTIRWDGYDGVGFAPTVATELLGAATENWSTTAHGSALRFRTIQNGTTFSVDRMTVNHNGYIGIGTTSPTSNLEINTGSSYNGITLKSSFATLGGAFLFIDPNVNTLANTPVNTLWLDQKENADIVLATGNLARFWVKPNGNVGIGINSPSHVLHISGQGRSTNSAWATTSDKRLKDIEKPFEYGLKELLNVNTYRFRYKKGNSLNLPTDKSFQGVIAQELQKTIPEAVTLQNDGYLTVNNDPVFWTMVNAIKEQQAIINEQKKKIEELEKQNQTMKSETQILKSDISDIKAQLEQVVKQVYKK